MAKKKVDISENIEVIEEYQEVMTEPVDEAVVETAVESVDEPVAEAVVETVDEAVVEPEAEPVDEPVAEAVEPDTEAVEPVDEPEPDLTDVTVVTPTPATQNVFVCYLSPQGLRLKARGRTVTLNGAKVSDIVTHRGDIMRSGKFGITCVSREDWDAILAVYSKTKLFKSGRILTVNNEDDIALVTAENNSLRHGREQVDPTVDTGVKAFEQDD